METFNESISNAIKHKHPIQLEWVLIINLITMDFFLFIATIMYEVQFSVLILMVLIALPINVWGIIVNHRLYELQLHTTALIGVIFFSMGISLMVWNIKFIYYMFELQDVSLIYGQILFFFVIWGLGSILDGILLNMNYYYNNQKYTGPAYIAAYIFSTILLISFVLVRVFDERFAVIITFCGSILLGIVGLSRLYRAYLMVKYKSHVTIYENIHKKM